MAVDEMTQTALMVTIARGAAAREAQSGVERVLDRLDKKTKDAILDRLEHGEPVSGQEALLAWQQLLTNRRLRRELEKDETAGVVAAVAMKPAMDGRQEV